MAARLTRPVCRPLAVTFDHTDELTRNDAICLLAGVQLVVPQETVWARIDGAVEIGVACDVGSRGTVEVGGRVVVDVGQLSTVLVSACLLSHSLYLPMR